MQQKSPPKIKDEHFQVKVQTIFEEAVQLYRKIHQYPEIGLQEYSTSATCRQYLNNIEGIEVLPPLQTLPTAIIAQITPQIIQETILLRCQLDALCFKQASNLQFSAQNGFHHACGHDAHMAVMLTAAKLIAEEKALLKKKVIFCFQPGEEGKKGANKLLKACPFLMEAVKNCYALHFHNAIYPGWVKIDPGPVTTLSNRFTIQIEGRSAHCMTPQAGIDANFIGCALVSSLYTLTGTAVPPMQGCSLAILKVQGGSQVAMISSNFKIIGSLRTFSMESYQKMKDSITTLSQSFCSSFGAKVKIDFNQLNYRPVINNQQLVERIRKKIVEKGQFKIGKEQRSFAGEDFCQFSQKRQSCYIAVGSALPESIDAKTGESIFPAHSPRHKIDEKAILYGIKLWMLIVFD